jgi:hypothetical protein
MSTKKRLPVFAASLSACNACNDFKTCMFVYPVRAFIRYLLFANACLLLLTAYFY